MVFIGWEKFARATVHGTIHVIVHVAVHVGNPCQADSKAFTLKNPKKIYHVIVSSKGTQIKRKN